MNREWHSVREADYDIAIIACGYEARSTFISKEIVGEIGLFALLDYESEDEGSYNSNSEYFEHFKNVERINVSGQRDASRALEELLLRVASGRSKSDVINVLFDISSCSRSTLAQSLLALSRSTVSVTFAYAVSEWFEPPVDEPASSFSEPVLGDLAGWSDNLTSPPCAVVGLGFEPGRALGTIDYLEVPEVRLFLPDGPDSRFKAAVTEANVLLIDEIGERTIPYDIRDPSDIHQKLSSLISGLVPNFRPIIIPFGPKIFAVISMLLAVRSFPNLCIWRTSSGNDSFPKDRDASGEVIAFQYDFSPTEI